MASQTELVILVHVLAGMGFLSGALIQSLPIPMRSVKSLAPTLQWDAILAEIGIGTVYSVNLLEQWIQSLIASSVSIPTDPGNAYALIIAQLAGIDTAIFVLIATVNSTLIFAPLADLLARMLGSAAGWVTNSIILWSVLQIAISQISSIWLLMWTVGIVFFAIPFRLGKRFGAYLMSTSIVSAIALPLLPSFALWLEGQIGYQSSLTLLQNLGAGIVQNPANAIGILTALSTIIGNLFAAVIIALIVFPVSYLFMISLIARSVASLIMGMNTPSSLPISFDDFLR